MPKMRQIFLILLAKLQAEQWTYVRRAARLGRRMNFDNEVSSNSAVFVVVDSFFRGSNPRSPNPLATSLMLPSYSVFKDLSLLYPLGDRAV